MAMQGNGYTSVSFQPPLTRANSGSFQPPFQTPSPMGTPTMQVVSPQKVNQKAKLMLPRGCLQNKEPSPGPAPSSWGAFPAASPSGSLSKPMITPQNATTAWRTAVCPFAPMRHNVRQPGSLDPTPTSTTSGPGMMTPANIWPDNTPSSGYSQGQHWPAPGPLTAQIFAGGQSPFSADLTPINATANGGQSTRSRRSANDMDWLRQLWDAPYGTNSQTLAGTEPSTPSSLFAMGSTSSMSLDPLNVARIESGPCVTPMAGGESGKGSDGEAFFFKRGPAPDNGPSFAMRHLGA